MSDYDIIVMGAGHNGLTSAAYMAKTGERVLVIENEQLRRRRCFDPRNCHPRLET